MYEVCRDHFFSAAHQLRGYQGKCESLHGHNWKVRICVRAETLDHLGMVVDFKELKSALLKVIDTLDHQHINEIPPFDSINPSAENLAQYIAENVHEIISDSRVYVHSCQIWESERSMATYFISP